MEQGSWAIIHFCTGRTARHDSAKGWDRGRPVCRAPSLLSIIISDSLYGTYLIYNLYGYVQVYASICSMLMLCLLVGWLVVLRINVDLAVFQPYVDL